MGLFRLRRCLLVVEFETNDFLMVQGPLPFAASTRPGFQILRPMRVLAILGLRESALGRLPQHSIPMGIKARSAPCYVRIFPGLPGGVHVNRLTLYLIVTLWLPGICVIVLLEA